MKASLVSLILFSALLPGLAGAADGHAMHAGHGAAAANPGQAALVNGVVKKVDKSAGKLTITHDALPNGMPAMTMPFKVKENAWLDKVQPGQKIRFSADTVDGALTVTRLEIEK